MALVCVAFSSSRSFGWGAEGHEVINYEARNKIADTPAGQCLGKNEDAFVLMAIAPDYFWKSVGTSQGDRVLQDPQLKRLRAQHNATEHSYHFFEWNAFAKRDSHGRFIRGSVPSSGSYMDLMPQYEKLLQKNVDLVKLIDPEKFAKMQNKMSPTPRDVADHGTAPWRIVQMYHEAVKALKKGDVKTALVFLGAMGHYVGDMSQIFHVILNYDGEYPLLDPKHPEKGGIAAGIHSGLETHLLNLYAAKKGGAHIDRTTYLWNNYDSTHAGIAKAMNRDLSAIAENEIVANVIALAETGVPYGDPLDKVFAAILAKHPARGHAEPVKEVPGSENMHPRGRSFSDNAPVIQDFLVASVAELDDKGNPTGKKITVPQLVEKRLAKSVDLLSRLLVSAFEQAKTEFESEEKATLRLDCDQLVDLKDDADTTFHEKIETLAIKTYQKADYMPASAQPEKVPIYMPASAQPEKVPIYMPASAQPEKVPIYFSAEKVAGARKNCAGGGSL
jgi:hypothetical protein